MPITKETVEYVAQLARIELTQEELKKLSIQLKDIIGFIDKLSALDLKNIVPASHILPISNVLRDDSRGESLPADKALANAPSRENTFFVVPKVIE